MKNKALLLTLAAALMLTSAPLWADATMPPNPCDDPGKQSDPIARHNYLTCLNEYVANQQKAIELHNKAAHQALTLMREYQLAPKEGGK